MASAPPLSQLTIDNSGGTTSTDPLAEVNYKRGVKYLVETTPNLQNLPSAYVLPLPISPLSVSDDSIPVIDLSGLSRPNEQRVLTIRAIVSACADWGFFRVRNAIHFLSCSS